MVGHPDSDRAEARIGGRSDLVVGDPNERSVAARSARRFDCERSVGCEEAATDRMAESDYLLIH